MTLDLTNLRRAAAPGAELVDAINLDGPFTGTLMLDMGVDAHKLRIDGTHVLRIDSTATTARIWLKIAAPVVGHEGVAFLEMELAYAPASKWTVALSPGGWFKDKNAPITGKFNAWLVQNGGAAQLKLSGGSGFPIEQFGVAAGAVRWSRRSSHELHCGIFGSAESQAMLVLLPSGDSSGSNDPACKGLALFGLTNEAFGSKMSSWQIAPVMFGMKLSSRVPGPLWHALVSWAPVQFDTDDAHYSRKDNRLDFTALIEAIWNVPVRRSLDGLRIHRAAQPMSPLPILTFTYDMQGSESKHAPLLMFEKAVGASEPAKLRHIHMSWSEMGCPISAEFPLRRSKTSLNTDLANATLPTLSFIGKINSPGMRIVPTRTGAKGEMHDHMRELLEKAIAVAEDPNTADLLMSWTAVGGATLKGSDGDWLVWSSMEVHIPANTKAALSCVVRGSWTAGHCDAYPEMVLELEGCKLRSSAAADAAGKNLDAAFDSQDSFEDNLQRESDPIRFARGEVPYERKCRVKIRHRTEAGRNAVTRVEVYSEDRKSLGDESFVLQMRPFSVGMVKPADLDAEGGELIAMWSSNDPEGVQWRVPDATASVVLQPQAVGEAMERGVRFWSKASDGTPLPNIDTARPLLYRFSPPTSLVVRPSIRDRRYNKAPTQLGSLLADAKVESFITEIAYPIEAKFQVNEQGLPDIRVRETGSIVGQPAENLIPPKERLLPEPNGGSLSMKRWLQDVYAAEVAAFAFTQPADELVRELTKVRGRQSAAKASFVARLAQHHVYNPWSSSGHLGLKEQVNFRIRDTNMGAPPLLNPLSQWKFVPPATKHDLGSVTPAPSDLLAEQKRTIHGGTGRPNFLSSRVDQPDWGRLDEGAFPGGIAHTMEFASELVAVLRKPVATTGQIDSLSFTALGANGEMTASFDEGRTIFVAQASHGQLSRLIKIRIGRIGVMWNKAKHVIVYERTTVASTQFMHEQEFGEGKKSRGWPILRKTQEYVEPIELVRAFEDEEQRSDNHAAFLAASEFVSPRIYVNGGWGRDLRHGYEIPLWDRSDPTGFYPKPQIALRARAGGQELTRCWHDEPEHLVFYTNTQSGKGNEPDKWPSFAGVDRPLGLERLPVVTQPPDAQNKQKAVMEARQLPGPRLGGLRRPRFDFAVVCDGKVNLQHSRGETEMLAVMDVVSLIRSSEVDRDSKGKLGPVFDQLQKESNQSAQVAAAQTLQAKARGMIERFCERLITAGGQCDAVKEQLKQEIRSLFDETRTSLAQSVQAIPEIGEVPSLVPLVGKLERELLDYDRVLRAPLNRLLTDMAQLRASCQASGEGDRDQAVKQLKAASQTVSAVFASAQLSFDTAVWRLSRIGSAAGQDVASILASVLAEVADLKKIVGNATVPSAREAQEAREACRKAIAALLKTTGTGVVGEGARRCSEILESLVRALDKQVLPKWQKTQATLAKAVDDLETLLKGLMAMQTSADASLNTLLTSIRSLVAQVLHCIDQAVTQLETAAQGKLDDAFTKATALVKQAHSLAEGADVQASKDLIGQWHQQVTLAVASLQALAADADIKIAAAFGAAIGYARDAARQLLDAANTADDWLTQLCASTLAVVDAIDCSLAKEIASGLRRQLEQAEKEVKERLTGIVNQLVDESTRARFAQLEAQFQGDVEAAAKGLKLVKALGELPELPTLTFNAERAEYVFDDFAKQIDTSPFAAKLREIDSGLKELGIAIPSSKLLDQVIPDSLKELDFSSVFKNIGAIDFNDFFKRFRLPELNSEQIKITQGVDKPTRTAWVSTHVDASFPQEQSLFEFSGLAVTVAQMKILADSNMRIGLNGERSSKTDASFTGNWGLSFGGARLATFREVSVKFNGSSFAFDIEPSKVELHPCLKFVDEFAKLFTPKLPPAVQIETDSRGIPVGARAQMTSEVVLPPLGIIEIGPMVIRSGLAMRMAPTGKFEINVNVSVGARDTPVWVQISYLGGGMWLEARATYTDKIRYTATLGLALGCIKAFNLASVARGSFSLLLFAYAEISDSGGSLRAGLSFNGSARILGVANASIMLLLEVVHGGGETKGHGTLDVKVDICWCYTLHVRREVEQQIN